MAHKARRWGLWFGLLATALAALPLFSNLGFLVTRAGGDSPFLLLRLNQLMLALQAGEFPVRWMTNAALGYGFPFFNHYAALPYYFAALLRFSGLSSILALKTTQLGVLLLGAWGVYAWARSEARSEGAAFLAAAAFTFAPFHLVNLYVRGDSLSELGAMALYPILLWRLRRLLDTTNFTNTCWLALATAALTLSHNISALNFMPFVGLYGLLNLLTAKAQRTQRKTLNPGALRAFAAPILALVWGLALAAFFWLPALGETNAAQIGDVTQGYFFYGNHFRWADLIQPALWFSYALKPGAPTPFSMGLGQTVLIALGLLMLVGRALQRRVWTTLDTFLLLGLALATFMITPVSQAVWDHAPLVKFTQFPWRFLSIQALFGAMVISSLIPNPSPQGRRERPSPFGGWVGGEGLALGLAAFLGLTSLAALRPTFVPLTEADLTPQTLQWTEYFSGNLGSTVGYEYLPRAVSPRPFASGPVLGRAPRLKVLSGSAAGIRQWQRGADERWIIHAHNGPATVAIPTFYWPGWHVWLDDDPIPARAAEGLGWITFEVPTGHHTVNVRLGRTPLRSVAEGVSLAASVIPLLIAVFLSRTGARAAKKNLKVFLQAFGSSWLWLLGLASFWLILRFWPAPPANLGPLSLDFVQLPIPHHDTIRFADGNALQRLSLSADQVARGDVLTLTTEWRVASPALATIRLGSNADLLAPIPLDLTRASQRLDPAQTRYVFTLTIPLTIPPGLYYPVIALPAPALTAQGEARGAVHLQPIVVDDDRLLAPAGVGPMELVTVTTAALAPTVVRVQPVWHTPQDVAQNYRLGLRVRDAWGSEWVALDTPLTFGVYPSPLWRPGETVPDLYDVAVPPGAPPGLYTLTLTLYDAAQNNVGVWQKPVALDASVVTNTVAQWALNAEIAVGAVDFPASAQQGESPELRIQWLTHAAPTRDYGARWSLHNAAGEAWNQIVPLAPGSSPLTWQPNRLVLGRLRVGLSPALAPGEYMLRLQLVDETESPVGAAVDIQPVTITGRARVFDLPPLAHVMNATFGPSLILHGYGLEQAPDTLRLTLIWGAQTAPGRDYKYFIHLFNPANENVAAQLDGRPRAETYPTDQWAAGEVVSDTLTLSLADVPPGHYALAVGWYDPFAPDQRLPVFNANGEPQLADRLIVINEIEKK